MIWTLSNKYSSPQWLTAISTYVASTSLLTRLQKVTILKYTFEEKTHRYTLKNIILTQYKTLLTLKLISKTNLYEHLVGSSRGRDRIIAGLTTTYAISELWTCCNIRGVTSNRLLQCQVGNPNGHKHRRVKQFCYIERKYLYVVIHFKRILGFRYCLFWRNEALKMRYREKMVQFLNSYGTLPPKFGLNWPIGFREENKNLKIKPITKNEWQASHDDKTIITGNCTCPVATKYTYTSMSQKMSIFYM